jgi:peptidoglycan hydrolase-like protein with peptidoglycan-binding domain
MMDLDPTITFGPPVQVFDAEWLQVSINKLGALPSLEVDGIAGAARRIAVRAFQTSHNLTVDGLCGPLTIAAINQDLNKLETK